MKIKVTLDNGSGEIASKIIENPEATEAADLCEQILEAITDWTLSVGDTITIREAS